MDFSPASLHAARQALPHLSDGAVVHLVHVWQRQAPLLPMAEQADLDEAYLRALPARFDRARALLGRERSLVFVATVREGEVTDTLVALAAELRADLVVAGARGLGLMERLLVGSTSTALLRGAPCSVLVAPDPPPTERARLLRHMTGTSLMRAPAEWAAELDAFALRNRHRRTALEIDDESLGAQVQETGYTLLGATYDHRDRHVSLMFGDPEHPESHLTRSLGKRAQRRRRARRGRRGRRAADRERAGEHPAHLPRPAGPLSGARYCAAWSSSASSANRT